MSQKSSLQSELVIFHADSVWSESGSKCGKERVVPGTEVSFTARKIPHGFVEGRRFQAKAVWLGTEAYPKFISPPPASRLETRNSIPMKHILTSICFPGWMSILKIMCVRLDRSSSPNPQLLKLRQAN